MVAEMRCVVVGVGVTVAATGADVSRAAAVAAGVVAVAGRIRKCRRISVGNPVAGCTNTWPTS